MNKTEYQKQWAEKNKEYLREYRTNYRKTHPDIIKAGRHRQYLRYKVRWALRRERWYRNLKFEVFNHYSNNDIKCATCGFRNIVALSIDHLANNGAVHKRIIGSKLYSWLKNNKYPPGFQVLCMNCQFIRRHESKNDGRPKVKYVMVNTNV